MNRFQAEGLILCISGPDAAGGMDLEYGGRFYVLVTFKCIIPTRNFSAWYVSRDTFPPLATAIQS